MGNPEVLGAGLPEVRVDLTGTEVEASLEAEEDAAAAWLQGQISLSMKKFLYIFFKTKKLCREGFLFLPCNN